MGMGTKSKPRRKAPRKHALKPKEHFVKGVLVRGEAVPEGQPLVPGATHEVNASDPDHPTIRRKRFSLA